MPANAVYRPLVVATLALDYWFGGGLEVSQFHLSQLAMLLVLAVMVFFLFRRLLDAAEEHWWNRYAALLAALLFSVHATGTETLNLIHARSELLSAIGIVGSFLAYLYMPRSRRTHLYLLPMIVGALAKPPAVMFAPLFLVYVVLFEKGLSVPDVFTVRGAATGVCGHRKEPAGVCRRCGRFCRSERHERPDGQLWWWQQR